MDPIPTDTPTGAPALRGTRSDDNVPERAIYVACLASYNAGILFGEWIDAAQDVDAIRGDIAAMLVRSPCPNVTVTCPVCEGEANAAATCSRCKGAGTVPSAEEWAVHDYQGFEGITLGEWPDLAEVAALALALEEHGEAFAKWYENGDGRDKDPAEWAEAFQECYQGTFRDLTAYAEACIDDVYDLDQLMGSLASYFDYEKFGRDLELGGDVWTCDGGDGIYVFRNC